MEAFSLLKFWRFNPTDDDAVAVAPTHLPDVSDDDDTSSEDSFFDLEFTLPGQQDSPKKDTDSASDFPESPNNVFCKSEPNSKPQSPISFLRSPPKFKVLMFLKKPKLEKTTETTTTSTPNAAASPSTPSRFAVKCDVDEFPIWSLLNRVNSTSRTKLYNKSSDEELSKGLGKGGVQKYLKLIKLPYNVGVPKRHGGDDVKVSDPTSSPAAGQKKEAERKQGSTRTASLRVVGKLVKSRSASSAVGVVPPATTASKRDDSLVLQQDGIQGAILHCKKSYNNSSSRDCSLLSRFAGETSSETSGSARNSSEEDDEKKRSSI